MLIMERVKRNELECQVESLQVFVEVGWGGVLNGFLHKIRLCLFPFGNPS